VDNDMTVELFREDGYRTECPATVVAVGEDGVVILDQTVFYPTGGGQPGDSGVLITGPGGQIRITTTRYRDGTLVHVPEPGQTPPAVGDTLTCRIDWDRRHRLMRMHTAMHLLCSLVPCGVTGGQVGESRSRLDFDVGETALDKAQLTDALNLLVEADHAVSMRWVSDAELDANPELVRTLSVAPPRGQGRVRLIGIGETVDLQPCGGTHVARTGEIGRLRIGKIESKGARNRRVQLLLDEPAP
jgi:misacylated tRNA(Ala) deacylase